MNGTTWPAWAQLLAAIVFLVPVCALWLHVKAQKENEQATTIARYWPESLEDS